MGVLVLITFLGANLHAMLWQSSTWLVSTVLPAVVVNLTNEERVSNAAAPLQRNSVLDEAARLKAVDMAKNEYFSHFSPTGVSPWYWFDKAGYVYAHAGENLAIHFTDSSEVVEAWMKSPLHRQNIVNGVYTEIGVGTAKGRYDGYDTVYVVQLFGTPAAVPAVDPELVPVTEVAEPSLVETAPETAFEPETTTSVVAEDVSDSEVVAGESTSEETATETEPVVVTEASETDEILDTKPEELAVTETETLSASENDNAQDIPQAINEETVLNQPDVVIIESPLISTSSGLAIANITTPNDASHAGATLASIVTQPNALLQFVYMILGSIVLFLLGISIVLEARRLHYMQAAYGVLLLLGMGGLWFVNSLLTQGAVIMQLRF